MRWAIRKYRPPRASCWVNAAPPPVKSAPFSVRKPRFPIPTCGACAWAMASLIPSMMAGITLPSRPRCWKMTSTTPSTRFWITPSRSPSPRPNKPSPPWQLRRTSPSFSTSHRAPRSCTSPASPAPGTARLNGVPRSTALTATGSQHTSPARASSDSPAALALGGLEAWAVEGVV